MSDARESVFLYSTSDPSISNKDGGHISDWNNVTIGIDADIWTGSSVSTGWQTFAIMGLLCLRARGR